MAPVRTSCSVFTVLVIVNLIHDSSSADICIHPDIPDGALPICTSSTRTGNTIFIDTSVVPPNEAISCSCSVDLDVTTSTIQSIHVGYEPAAGTTKQCGLEFQTGSRKFTCSKFELIQVTDSFSDIKFSKTTVDANACFILFIDYHAREGDKRNASVHCNQPHQTSQSTSFRTSTDRLNTATETSHPSMSGTTDTTSQTRHTNLSVAPPTSLNGLTSSFETTSVVSDRQTTDENKESNSTTVIIAAVSGAVGACVIIVVVVVVYCCCRRRTAKANTAPHGYVNTSLDAEVTENVVYNMEFPPVKGKANIQLNNFDVTYDNNEDVTYNTIDYTSDNKEANALCSFKQEFRENDLGTYNTADDGAGVSQMINSDKQEATDQSYETLKDEVGKTAVNNDKHEHVQENNYTSEKQHENSDVTYSVVDKSRSSEKPCKRQQIKHFEVSESGDTYAVVDKTSSK